MTIETRIDLVEQLSELLDRRNFLRILHNRVVAYELQSTINEARRRGYLVVAARLQRKRNTELRRRCGRSTWIEVEIDQIDAKLQDYGIPYDY